MVPVVVAAALRNEHEGVAGRINEALRPEFLRIAPRLRAIGAMKIQKDTPAFWESHASPF